MYATWLMIVLTAVLLFLFARTVMLLNAIFSELVKLREHTGGAQAARTEIAQINEKTTKFMELHADKMDKLEGHLYECKQYLGLMAK